MTPAFCKTRSPMPIPPRSFGAAFAAALLLATPAAHAQSPTAQSAPAESQISAPDMLARVLPSVVNIAVWSSQPSDTGAAGKAPPGDNHIFGSGFIVGEDGLIVTNRHVIQGAETISVVFQDRSRLPARVVGVADLVDLAVLKVEPDRKLPVLPFGDSDELRVGERVYAIGNALGVGTSVSAGVVSALNRELRSTPFDDFVQTDAAINHGNSGGPLVDAEGNVIGVDTLLRTPAGGNGSVGVGFAIPSNDIAFVVSRLAGPGANTNPGWIGVTLQDVTPEIGDALGMKQSRGVVVLAVDPNGPAARAGLHAGDVIIATEDEQNADSRAILREAAETSVGDAIRLTIWSHGTARVLPVMVGPWPDIHTPVAMAPDVKEQEPSGMGLQLAPLTPALRQRFGLHDQQPGLVVASVDERSEARDRGLRPGDVVVQVQMHPVTTLAEADAAFAEARKEGRSFASLLVHRKKGPKLVPIWLGGTRTKVPMAPVMPVSPSP